MGRKKSTESPPQRSRLTTDEIAAIHDGRSSGGLELPEGGGGGDGGPPVPDKFAMQQKSSMDLSGRKLDALPPEVVGEAVEANVQRIDLSKNRSEI